MMEKLPPVEKVYEAYTAIADGRIHLGGKENETGAGTGVGGFEDPVGSAQVVSSDGSRTYTVSWDGDIYASDDNATYWQGYAGYPVIAVLMLQHRLPCDLSVLRRFDAVPWKELNDRHKGDYGAALQEAFELKGLGDEEVAYCRKMAQRAHDLLADMDLTIRRPSRS